MSKHDTFILRENTASHLRHRWGVEELLCYRCGEVVRPGETVHKRVKGQRIYHLKCWESLLEANVKKSHLIDAQRILSRNQPKPRFRSGTLSPQIVVRKLGKRRFMCQTCRTLIHEGDTAIIVSTSMGFTKEEHYHQACFNQGVRALSSSVTSKCRIL